MQAYITASTPFGLWDYTAGTPASPGPPPVAATSGSVGSIAPRTYPYLNDEFFYTGYGAIDSSDVFNTTVGGYGADGWFKMFEFFEVPSQSVGAVGPVAAGSNFDWLRNDIKPGQLNPNLIMDEEVFFSIAGAQSITQSNGQYTKPTFNPMDPTTGPEYQQPSDQFEQQLLNFNQIPGLPEAPASTPWR